MLHLNAFVVPGDDVHTQRYRAGSGLSLLPSLRIQLSLRPQAGPAGRQQPQVPQQMPALGPTKVNASFRLLHQPSLCGPTLVASQTGWGLLWSFNSPPQT